MERLPRSNCRCTRTSRSFRIQVGVLVLILLHASIFLKKSVKTSLQEMINRPPESSSSPFSQPSPAAAAAAAAMQHSSSELANIQKMDQEKERKMLIKMKKMGHHDLSTFHAEFGNLSAIDDDNKDYNTSNLIELHDKPLENPFKISSGTGNSGRRTSHHPPSSFSSSFDSRPLHRPFRQIINPLSWNYKAWWVSKGALPKNKEERRKLKEIGGKCRSSRVLKRRIANVATARLGKGPEMWVSVASQTLGGRGETEISVPFNLTVPPSCTDIVLCAWIATHQELVRDKRVGQIRWLDPEYMKVSLTYLPYCVGCVPHLLRYIQFKHRLRSQYWRAKEATASSNNDNEGSAPSPTPNYQAPVVHDDPLHFLDADYDDDGPNPKPPAAEMVESEIADSTGEVKTPEKDYSKCKPQDSALSILGMLGSDSVMHMAEYERYPNVTDSGFEITCMPYDMKWQDSPRHTPDILICGDDGFSKNETIVHAITKALITSLTGRGLFVYVARSTDGIPTLLWERLMQLGMEGDLQGPELPSYPKLSYYHLQNETNTEEYVVMVWERPFLLNSTTAFELMSKSKEGERKEKISFLAREAWQPSDSQNIGELKLPARQRGLPIAKERPPTFSEKLRDRMDRMSQWFGCTPGDLARIIKHSDQRIMRATLAQILTGLLPPELEYMGNMMGSKGPMGGDLNQNKSSFDFPDIDEESNSNSTLNNDTKTTKRTREKWDPEIDKKSGGFNESSFLDGIDEDWADQFLKNLTKEYQNGTDSKDTKSFPDPLEIFNTSNPDYYPNTNPHEKYRPTDDYKADYENPLYNPKCKVLPQLEPTLTGKPSAMGFPSHNDAPLNEMILEQRNSPRIGKNPATPRDE